MNRTIVYIHGKGGSAAEAEHYRSLFPEDRVTGFDYHAQTPWEAQEEFPAFMETLRRESDTFVLIANSIGAYFSLVSLAEFPFQKAYFISPVADMEKLITDMMLWAGVTEETLREKGTVGTAFGETLSWEYLCRVRQHPVSWRIPTAVLYGGKDNLQSIETIRAFANRTGASLTVMENGEHWFHTTEQMEFLDRWITEDMKDR